MTVQEKLVSAEEFDAFVTRPENRERQFELIGGMIVESLSRPYSSKIAARVSGFIGMYLLNNDIVHLPGFALRLQDVFPE